MSTYGEIWYRPRYSVIVWDLSGRDDIRLVKGFECCDSETSYSGGEYTEIAWCSANDKEGEKVLTDLCQKRNEELSKTDWRKEGWRP